MRNTDDAGELKSLDNVWVARLDVTDLSTIKQVVAGTNRHVGPIDVLVNNAGYGAYGPLEATPRDSVVRQFHTNVIGLIDTIQVVLPHFRKQKSGTIVNISSVGGIIGMPLGSLYHSTKFAVEGLSEALMYELEAIGVRIKIVQPGLVDTDFNSRSIDINNNAKLKEYQALVQRVVSGAADPNAYRPGPDHVAGVIYEAVTDGSNKLRYLSGDDAFQNIARRKETDEEEFLAGMRVRFGLSSD